MSIQVLIQCTGSNILASIYPLGHTCSWYSTPRFHPLLVASDAVAEACYSTHLLPSGWTTSISFHFLMMDAKITTLLNRAPSTDSDGV